MSDVRDPDEEIDASSEVEKKHVLEVYDSIASHFSETRYLLFAWHLIITLTLFSPGACDWYHLFRYKPWPRVADFLLSLRPGSLVYDIGCGNGKYFTVNSALHMVGCDASANLLAICKEKQMDSVVGDVLALPFRSASADHFICIAVVHHLASEKKRIAALAQLNRILKPSGTGLIYVWAFEQSRVGCTSNYTTKKGSGKEKEEEEEKKHSNRVEVTSSGGEKIIKDTECANDSRLTRETQITSSNALPVHESRTPFKQQDVRSNQQMKDSTDF